METNDLFMLLDTDRNIYENWEAISESMNTPSFSEYLQALVTKQGLTAPELGSKALMSRSFTYQLLSGARMPGKDVTVRIAIALGLSLDETQRLLKLADKGALYPKQKRDAAIIYAINNKYSLYQTDEMLKNLGQEPIL